MRRYLEGGQTIGRISSIVTFGLILGATLMPSYGAEPDHWSPCLICGPRGVADAIANVLLFLPLGAALVLAGWRTPSAILCAALLSLTVEVAQMRIPGRDPSFGDLFFNTLGAAVGAGLVLLAVLWSRLSRGPQAGISVALAVLVAGVLLLPGPLLQPAPTDLPLYGWVSGRPDLPERATYLERARIGEIAIASRAFADSRRVAAALAQGEPLELRVVAGPATEEPGALLRIYDARLQELLVIGRAADDLLVRYRIRAAGLRLDEPSLRLVGAFRGTAPSSVVTITIRRAGGEYCISVGGSSVCGLGFTPASGWSLIFFSESIPPFGRSLLSLLWMAGLAFPVGLLSRGRPICFVAALVLAVAAVPGARFGGLLAATVAELVALLGSFALAAGLGAKLRGTRRIERPARTRALTVSDRAE